MIWIKPPAKPTLEPGIQTIEKRVWRESHEKFQIDGKRKVGLIPDVLMIFIVALVAQGEGAGVLLDRTIVRQKKHQCPDVCMAVP